MRFSNLVIFTFCILIYGCSKSENSPEFINQTSGRYLFNSDEIIEVYYKENNLFLKWHGAEKIKPLKLNNNTFFVKEMNEKIRFLQNPKDNQMYLSLAPKHQDSLIKYNYRKLKDNENIPSYYLENKDYKKAKEGYLTIQKQDSLDMTVKESNLNSKGYRKIWDGNLELAIKIFEINVALYPNSSNVYDSLGEALLKNGDTIQALVNYKKSLALDSGNKKAKRIIGNLEKQNKRWKN